MSRHGVAAGPPGVFGTSLKPGGPTPPHGARGMPGSTGGDGPPPLASHGLLPPPTDTGFDISMSSASAVFLLNNEYGFNTTHVSGRFRTANPGALSRFSHFFLPQNLVRQGYGIAHPFATATHLAGSLIGKLRPGA